ncbi:MAG: IS66 family insertion sequence element accessory protein TnpB [Deltaproteobacteria bacterium]|nr:IS66 family insertion sequence element accessory protein TnpB [Deltaproteobacteria bacterium]
MVLGMESSTTTEIWAERVSAWRASGERAETFSRRGGYAASTLRWWASKLKREMAAARPTPATVQLARVLRTPTATAPEAHAPGLVLEVVDAGVRIAVEPGTDPAMLAMVLAVVRGGRA